MKKIILIALSNFIYSNVNFEIINLPKNIYSLNMNDAILQQINNVNNSDFQYSTNFLQYPNNIVLYNVTTKNDFSINVLDYGLLENQINNENINNFRAYEALIQYHFSKKYKQYKIKLTPSIVYGQIDSWSATALFTNLSLLSKNIDNNIYFNASIKKIGIILNSYSNTNEYLPMSYHVGLSKHLIQRKLYWALDANYDNGLNQLMYSFSINKKINNKIILLANLNSKRKKLSNDNLFNNIFAGLSGGLIFKEKKFNLGVGISSLGPAGYIYCISFEFK